VLGIALMPTDVWVAAQLLVAAVNGLSWKEGPFKSGWESACEEILARMQDGPDVPLPEATRGRGTQASHGDAEKSVTVEMDSGGWWVIYLDGKPFSKCVDRDYAGQCAERLRVALQRAPRPPGDAAP
jgi:hypothetical protein